MYQKFVFSFLAMILLAQCAPGVGNNTIATVDNTSVGNNIKASATSIPITKTIAPVSKVTPISVKTQTLPSSITNLPEVTETINSQREMDCYSHSHEKYVAVNEGAIVFSGEIYNTPASLLNLGNGELKPIPSEQQTSIYGIIVSPDHKWFAYQLVNKTKASQLVISSVDGTSIKVIAWDTSWRKIIEWISPERILISKKTGDYEVDSIVVIDPSSGNQIEIMNEFPDMFPVWIKNSNNWGSYNMSGAIFNADMSKVLYPSTYGENHGVILFDIQAKKQIASHLGGFGHQPKWRPDYSGVLVDQPVGDNPQLLSSDEFFFIAIDGQEKQLTNLNRDNNHAAIGFFSWSPNGEQVAFWLSSSEPESYPDLYPDTPATSKNRLAILDIATGKVTDTCVPGDYNLLAPLWSPDGRFVVVADYFKADFPQKGQVFMVDLKKKSFTTIAENLFPIGWLLPIK